MKDRTRKLILVAAASLGGVAMIAVLSWPRDGEQARSAGTAPLLDSQLPPPPTGVEPNRAITQDMIGTAEGGQWVQVDPQTNRLRQRFAWRKLTPREAGVFDVVGPEAWVHLSERQVVHIRSDTARVVAPGNYPESGEFSDNLVMTVYRTNDARQLDLSPRSADRALKIKLDAATFDTTLGEIRSASPVDLTTPATRQVHFQGRGLRMIFNTVEQRIDYLEIAEGESVRFNPNAAPTASATAARDAADEGKEKKAPSKDDRDSPPQFYRVDFEQAVHVQTAERSILAETLLAFFTMDRRSDQAQPALETSARKRWTAAPLVMAQVKSDAPPASSTTLTASSTDEDVDAMPHREDDITLTWRGRMIMKPLEARPDEFTADRDLYVRFEGKPVTVRAENDQQMLCAMLDYADAAERLVATGSEAYPLRISSPQVGDIDAQALTATLADSKAQLSGPGKILAASSDSRDDEANSSRRLPAGFNISYSENLQLVFAGREGLKQGRIESAEFTGDVKARSSDGFAMDAHSLTAQFDPTIDPDGDPQVKLIDAAGEVNVKMRDGNMTAGKMRVSLEPDADGRYVPRVIHAQDDVNMVDSQRSLAAGDVNITLTDKKSDSATTAAADKPRTIEQDLGVEPKTIRAERNVRLTVEDAIVLAERLEADAERQTAQLFGSPVRVTSGGDKANRVPPQTELHAPSIRVEDGGDIVHCEGAGRFIYTEATNEKGENGSRIDVTWTERMSVDQHKGLIEVFGNVVSEVEQDARRTDSLKADEMKLEFVDLERVAAAVESKPVDQPPNDDDGAWSLDRAMGKRALRALTATGNVELLGTEFTDATRQRIATRLLIKGPAFHYDKVAELARVTGKGSMLVEDYRFDDRPVAERGARSLGGRGQTAFTWTDHLHFNFVRKRMEMEGSVYMMHRPNAVSEELVRMWCRRLEAEAKSMQAINPVARNDIGELDLDFVLATGAVTLQDDRSGDRVWAEKIYFDGATQTIDVQAGAGESIIVQHGNDPRPFKADVFRWNLITDEKQAIRARQ